MFAPISEKMTRPVEGPEDAHRPAIVVSGRETVVRSDRVTTVGRSVKADVTLAHGTDMSREHVGFGRDGRWVWVEQIAPGTTSEHDGQNVPRGSRRLWLFDGAIIRFCGWTVEVRAQDGERIDRPQLRRLAFAVMSAGPGSSRAEVHEVLQEREPQFSSKTLSNQLGQLADFLEIPDASRGPGNTHEMLTEIRRQVALRGRPIDLSRR